MTHPPTLDGFDPQRARRAVRRGLVSAGLVVACLVLVLAGLTRTDIGAAAAGDLLVRIDPLFLLGAAGLMSLAFVAMALRWRALMPRGHHPPTAGLTAIILAGLLLNYAVPGPFGELGAAWFAHKRYGVPIGDSLASGVTARLVGLATAAFVAAGIWAVFELPVPEGYDAIVGAAAGVSGLGGLALAAMASRPLWWKSLARSLSARAPAIGPVPRIAARLSVAISELADALAGVLQQGAQAWFRAVAWSMAGHAAVTSGIVVAVLGLGRAPDLPGLAFTYATTT
ncbi:MAG: lysylphosphatidylglycerol synthase transmembrane domain-containing protein, partial [Myxococcota bacterium]|nr:lysylphosphatidylglycerol synthase transmembrane domain-containing protein [Myxococcota bacterium]